MKQVISLILVLLITAIAMGQTPFIENTDTHVPTKVTNVTVDKNADLSKILQSIEPSFYLPDNIFNTFYSGMTLFVQEGLAANKEYLAEHPEITTDKIEESSWKNTLEYDSRGRLITYSRGSCIACNWQYQNWNLTYNDNNQLVSISTGHLIITSDVNASRITGPHWQIQYRENGQIEKITYSASDNKVAKVIMIKYQ